MRVTMRRAALPERERGAVKIQVVLVLVLIAIVAFAAIRIIPVYIEQEKVVHEVDELARISAVRQYKDDRVEKEIGKLLADFEIPEGGITYARKGGHVVITVGYKRNIDLVVYNWEWAVAHEVEGKEL